MIKQSKTVIREFHINDYEKVLKLWDDVGIHYRPKGRDSRQSINKQIRTGQVIFLVAEISGNTIGVVVGTHDSRKGWINRLAVAQECQQQGIGRELVNKLEDYFNTLGIDVIACLIENENTGSKKFFQNIGYLKGEVEYFSKRKSPDV